MKKQPRKKTATSAFGSSGRISHDSSRFYTSRLYGSHPGEKVEPVHEKKIPPEVLNRVFHKSSESMDELPDNSVHLMITSPPYNVSKEYDEDLTLEEYRDLLRRVLRETYILWMAGGRA